MEAKIKDFHRKRRQERIWETLMFRGVMDKIKSASPSSQAVVADELCATSSNSLLGERTLSDDNVSVVSVVSSNNSLWSPEPSRLSKFTIITYCLYVLLWATVFLLALQYGFGAVYLVISGIIAICLNTRTGPKNQGEVSAYSVFNPNCEAIDGTLKAEQFEREFNLIRH